MNTWTHGRMDGWASGRPGGRAAGGWKNRLLGGRVVERLSGRVWLLEFGLAGSLAGSQNWTFFDGLAGWLVG